MEKKKLDELSTKILNTMLSGKGIGPKFTQLARELSKPRTTIGLRVRLLENNAIIKGYRPIVNWEKLGYSIQGYVGICCPDNVTPTLLNILKSDNSIEETFEVTTGKYDIFAKCKFKDRNEITELQKRIITIEGVKSIDIYLIGSSYNTFNDET
jgi:DNA-binding Lrp family transcriptional regulator